MTLPKIIPHGFQRRSFIYRQTMAAGAEFVEINGAAIAANYGGAPEIELDRASRMGLADLSVLPHTGFKGAGTVDWLTGQGLAIGGDSNVAYRQGGGEWVARLAPNEIFLLDGLAVSGALIDRLNQAWSWGQETPRRAIGYPVPRQDSHAWFMVTGRSAPDMFAKICGVDIGLTARDHISDHPGRAGGHGPAQRAMAGVEEEARDMGGADHRGAIGRHRAQAGPEAGFR